MRAIRVSVQNKVKKAKTQKKFIFFMATYYNTLLAKWSQKNSQGSQFATRYESNIQEICSTR